MASMSTVSKNGSEEHNYNLQSFGRSMGIYAIGTIGVRASSFLLIPLYAHFLPASEYGLLATLLTAIQVMVMVMDVGSGKAITRFAGEHRIGELVGGCLLISIVNSVIVTGVAVLLLTSSVPRDGHQSSILPEVILSCIAALSQSLFHNTMSQYRVRNQPFRHLVGSASAGAILYVLSWLLLVILHFGVRSVILSQIVAYSSLAIVAARSLRAEGGIGVSRPVIKRLLRYGLPLVIVLTGPFLTDLASLLYLGRFCSLETVAVYSLGYKIACMAGMFVILPFQTAYEPFVYARIDRPQTPAVIARLLSHLMLCVSFVAFGIAFVGRDLLAIIAPSGYSASYPIILLTLPLIAFSGMSFIGESLLTIRNKPHITGAVVAGVTACAVLTGYWTVRHWGMYGALSMVAMSYIGTALLLMWLGMKTFRIPLERKRLTASACMLVLFLAASFLMSAGKGHISYVVSPFLVAGGVIFVYFGMLNFREREAIRRVIGQARQGLGTAGT